MNVFKLLAQFFLRMLYSLAGFTDTFPLGTDLSAGSRRFHPLNNCYMKAVILDTKPCVGGGWGGGGGQKDHMLAKMPRVPRLLTRIVA